MKSYTAMLLNVAREKQIDSDVSKELVVRHLFNYGLSHPYTDKLVINLLMPVMQLYLLRHSLNLRNLDLVLI